MKKIKSLLIMLSSLLDLTNTDVLTCPLNLPVSHLILKFNPVHNESNQQKDHPRKSDDYVQVNDFYCLSAIFQQ
jgi:hypothetical protein